MRISSSKGWALIGGLAAAVVLALGWTLLISPMRSSTAEVEDQVSAQVATNGTQRDVVARLKAQAAGLPAQQAKLQALQATIPVKEQIPALVRAVSSSATATGVSLVEMTPASPTPVGASAAAAAASGETVTGGLQEIPLQIGVSGTYAQTTAFLASLEGMHRAVLVHGLDMSPTVGGAAGRYTTSIRAGVFVNTTPGVHHNSSNGSASGGGATPAPTSNPS